MMTTPAGMVKVCVTIGYDTMTRYCSAGAVMVIVWMCMLSIRMCVAVLAVMVTVSVMGAVMWMKSDGAVTVTAGDIGARMVRLAPIGAVLEKVHAMGEM